MIYPLNKMKKKQFNSVLITTVIFLVFTFTFILKNNDHKECDNITTSFIDDSGKETEVRKHNCIEKNNF